MKTIAATLLLFLLLPTFAVAQPINEFQWKNRVIVLFTPELENELFEQQYLLLKQRVDEMVDRRLITIMVNPDGDFENSTLFVRKAQADWYYSHFNARPFQFELVLVGLDGNVKYRARNVVTPPEKLFQLIDEMPMRRRELRQAYQNTGSENTEPGKAAVRYD